MNSNHKYIISNEKLAHKALVRQKIENKLKLLPDLPGCYIMRNDKDEIIYVGKAKNLKNRVRSYFRGAHDTKTTNLVSEIDHFETIVTNSNKEALILEINLIQEYKPHYNIKLKNGTMYPYLKITRETDPQLIITNDVKKDGALYFGPFPNVYAATTTQQVLHRAYPLRRCAKNDKRACFYYHLGQCIGCCDHPVSQSEYQDHIQKIKRFFNGETSEIKNELKLKMQTAAENMEFEQAADYRDQIKYIETTVERQNIMSQDYDNMDVFNYYFQYGYLSIQVFMLRQGSILKRQSAIFPIYDEPEDEVTTYIARFYHEQSDIKPRAIMVPSTVDHALLQDFLNIPVSTPLRGKKKSILELAEKNSKLALDEKFRLIEASENKTKHAVQELAEALNIPEANYIEAFDHSSISGTNNVSGMVVYRHGKPERKNYRKFKLKSIDKANEFAATQEVIRRRYTRLLQEEKPLPDLILMDGGIIETRAARDVLENELGLAIPVAGMVKNDKHKTAALLDGYNETIIDLDPRSQAFLFLQRIQDEVHRYAISYHRQVRSKNQLGSILEDIPGVGPKTRIKLLKHFKSLTNIRDADPDEFKKIGIPINLASTIVTYLKQSNKLSE